MKGHMKVLVFVVVAVVAISVGVYAYFLMLPRVSLLVYPDSEVTGCKERLNETVILHVKNDGTVDLSVNACEISQVGGLDDPSATYIFQGDVEIPVGVEAVIVFPAGGGDVVVETVSGPTGAVAGGGIYAISDNPDPNPFGMIPRTELWIHTRSGVIGGGSSAGGNRIAAME